MNKFLRKLTLFGFLGLSTLGFSSCKIRKSNEDILEEHILNILNYNEDKFIDYNLLNIEIDENNGIFEINIKGCANYSNTDLSALINFKYLKDNFNNANSMKNLIKMVLEEKPEEIKIVDIQNYQSLNESYKNFVKTTDFENYESHLLYGISNIKFVDNTVVFDAHLVSNWYKIETFGYGDPYITVPIRYDEFYTQTDRITIKITEQEKQNMQIYTEEIFKKLETIIKYGKPTEYSIQNLTLIKRSSLKSYEKQSFETSGITYQNTVISQKNKNVKVKQKENDYIM